jgi:hypothetical protein
VQKGPQEKRERHYLRRKERNEAGKKGKKKKKKKKKQLERGKENIPISLSVATFA